jgi:hypothetical protein
MRRARRNPLNLNKLTLKKKRGLRLAKRPNRRSGSRISRAPSIMRTSRSFPGTMNALSPSQTKRPSRSARSNYLSHNNSQLHQQQMLPKRKPPR